MKLVNWFKRLFLIVDSQLVENELLKAEILELRQQQNRLSAALANVTDIGVDIAYRNRDPNHIIIVGRYKNRDYVQTFTVETDDLAHFIDMLKSMEEHARVRKIDCPPAMRSVLSREFF